MSHLLHTGNRGRCVHMMPKVKPCMYELPIMTDAAGVLKLKAT